MPRENHLTGDVRITQTLAEKKKNHPNLLASTIKYQLPGTRKRISKSQSEPAYNPVSGTRERGDEAEGDKRLGVNSRGQTLSKCPRHRHGDVGAAQRRRKSPVSPVGETGVFLPPKGQHESSHRLDRSTAPPLRTGVIRRRRSLLRRRYAAGSSRWANRRPPGIQDRIRKWHTEGTGLCLQEHCEGRG